MKIIHHPKVLEERERQLEIERFNLEVSQHILQEKHKRVNLLVARLRSLVILTFIFGLIFGISASILFTN